MSIWSAIPTDSLTLLRQAVEEHVAPGRIRTTALSLCIEAVAFAREGEAEHVGMRARAAAHLLLDLTCPEIGDDPVRELSVACERAALARR